MNYIGLNKELTD